MPRWLIISLMRQHEQNFNIALGEVLEKQRHGWAGRINAEKNRSVINPENHKKGRADILIYPDDMLPVVAEAAYVNTPNIDGDAISRLGWLDGECQLEIMTTVAAAIPVSVKRIKSVAGIRKWLESGNELEYAVYSAVKDKDGKLPVDGYSVRYPDGKKNSGYIRGTAADLADLIELAATPDKKIKAVADYASEKIIGIADMMDKSMPAEVRQKIAKVVGQPAHLHATRVAVCVWLNAMVLQSKLAKAKPGDKRFVSPSQCKNWEQTKGAWESTLAVDYKSVFHPALRSWELLADYGTEVGHILTNLNSQIREINSLRIGVVADVSSDMFPTLATDRKVTAAFYTLPEAAELLAGMAFNLIGDVRCTEDGEVFKMADFACGTGALLKAAYRRVLRAAHRDMKCDLDAVHQKYMEDGLYGVDIQPIATNLTAARLAGMRAGAKYDESNIICANIKKGETGALELLGQQSVRDLFGVSKVRKADDDNEGEGNNNDFHAPHNSFDLCIMNPPYSRSAGGREIFGVEGVDAKERRDSVKNMSRQMRGAFANRQAGMPSAFCLLADKKLKKGGVFAAVLPLSVAAQSSWRKFREHMINHYSDIIVVGGCNFSADTSMEEMMICARKGGNSKKGITVVNLRRLPRDFVEAHEIARVININNLKNEGELKIGEHVAGICIKLNPQNGDSWGGVGAESESITFIANKLSTGELVQFNRVHKFNIDIAMKPLEEHVRVGPSHDDIGHPPKGDKRGAFAFKEYLRGVPVNMSLWRANCKTQTYLICEPTHTGKPVKGRERLAKDMLASQSTLFISRNLRFTSQTLAIAMTRAPCMGGRAWAALILSNNACASAYCLWLNSTLGLMCRWYHGGRQHSGRAVMQLADIKKFPCPVFSAKNTAAKRAVEIATKEFPRLANLMLMPCSFAWRDDNRKEIDAVVLRMLGLDKEFSESDMQALREAWCREQSVHGDTRQIRAALQADKLI